MAIKILNQTEQYLQYSILQLPSKEGGFTANGNLAAGTEKDIVTPTEGSYHVTGHVHKNVQDGSSVTFRPPT